MTTLPPDFPADLRRSLGVQPAPLPAYPGHAPQYLPTITDAMRDALALSLKTKGESH